MTNVEIAIDLFAKAIAFYYRAYGKDFELCVSEIRKRLRTKLKRFWGFSELQSPFTLSVMYITFSKNFLKNI